MTSAGASRHPRENVNRLLPLLIVVWACSAGPTARTPPSAERAPAQGLDDLMSTRDRAALARVAAAREQVRIEAGYRIGPDDLLDIRIPNLLGAREAQIPQAGATGPAVAEAPVHQEGIRVAADGTLNLPLLGTIRVAGLTPSQLEQQLAHRLVAERILVDPQVNVLVAEYRSQVAAVVGSVEKPGLYPVTRPGMRLADLVWAAGGPTRDAGRVIEFRPAVDEPASDGDGAVAERPACDSGSSETRRSAPGIGIDDLRLASMGSGRRITITFARPPDGMRSFVLDAPPRLVIDLPPSAAAGHDPAAELALDDDLVRRVRIARRADGVRIVFDLTQTPGRQTVRADGTTVVADLGDLQQLAAGACAPDPADEPAVDQPAITRPLGGDGGLIRVDLSILLQQTADKNSNPKIRPGDVVSLSPAGSVLVDGWVEKPGSYPVTRGLTLTGAVAAAGGNSFAADRRHATVKRVYGLGEERSFTVDLDEVAAGRMPDMPIADGDVVRVPMSSTRIVPWGVWSIGREVIHVGGSVLLF